MDNRLFNINGRGDDNLSKALELAFSHEGWSNHSTCSGWQQTKENGLILCWTDSKDINPFPSELTAKECMPFVTSWLKSDYTKDVILGEWCGDEGHDGHNEKGWQVYCEDWGHVGSQNYAICAIRPAFLWMGK